VRKQWTIALILEGIWLKRVSWWGNVV